MAQKIYSWFLAGALLAIFLTAGCVERRLTIVTEPKDAVVWLNDEEVGTAPVTVNFNWYGDYNVRIEKSGYGILNTHRELERPLHDRFPFDFFAEVLWPKKIVDEYTWTFELEPYQQTSPEELIQAAQDAQQRSDQELGKIADEILRDSGPKK
ncbi:MAG: PEGA domain-containing protein [Phycisphaerae bacterium]|nr:PEGA domain-containing protein [Phycisphaerae bacterium]